MQVIIRFMQRKDLIFNTTSHQTIQSIKHKILQQSNEHKNIRLIYRGQLLANDTWTLQDYKIESPIVYIHCQLSYHYEITPTHIEKRITKNSSRGFDKLKDSGYNEEEIRSIRTRFHQLHSTLDYIDGEPPTQRHVEQEEEWLEITGNRIPEESTMREMICGLLLGCFLGILNLFWFKETVFTRRHQMGILAGMLINVYYGITHVIH